MSYRVEVLLSRQWCLIGTDGRTDFDWQGASELFDAALKWAQHGVRIRRSDGVVVVSYELMGG